MNRDVPVGYQVPRIRHSPRRVSSAGPQAAELAATAGLYLDDWEALCLDEMLAERDVWYYNEILNREMRTYAAFEVGLVVPRQCGKGCILEARELAGLFLFGERLIVHSAHEFPTSEKAFERIAALIQNTPMLSKEIARGGIKYSHGSEGIYLRSGQQLLFKTRTKGGVRGFTGDCLILDEAMMGLSDSAVGALFPTLSARPNPQIIYTGSAGTKESTQLGSVRDRGIKGMDDRLAYLEWSIDPHTDFCPPDCTDHDRQDISDDEARNMNDEELGVAASEMVESYRKANPGLGIRITVEHVEAERRTMPKEVFARERLGVGDWPVVGEAWRVIDQDSWMAQFDELSEPQAPLIFAIDTTPDCSSSCIAMAGFNGELVPTGVEGDDGVMIDLRKVHVEITQDGQRYDHRAGRSWVVPRIKQLAETWKPSAIIIDKGGQAGVFVDELEEPLKELGVELIIPTMREYAQACGMFHGAVVPRKGNVPCLVHLNQPMLTNAVAGAEKRDLANMWAWDKRNASTDISPLVASTLALWGVLKAGAAPPPVKAWGFYG